VRRASGTGSRFGTSAISGSTSGVSGVASNAGRTLRTGETFAERSAAARVLPKAGGLAKDIAPFARAAPWIGAGATFAQNTLEGKSLPDSALHTGMSAAVATGFTGVAGGACELGTLGFGTPGCFVLGAGAAAAGGYIGDCRRRFSAASGAGATSG